MYTEWCKNIGSIFWHLYKHTKKRYDWKRLNKYLPFDSQEINLKQSKIVKTYENIEDFGGYNPNAEKKPAVE